MSPRLFLKIGYLYDAAWISALHETNTNRRRGGRTSPLTLQATQWSFLASPAPRQMDYSPTVRASPSALGGWVSNGIGLAGKRAFFMLSISHIHPSRWDVSIAGVGKRLVRAPV